MNQLTPEAYELFTEFNRNFFWIDDGIPDSSLLPLAATLRKLAGQLADAYGEEPRVRLSSVIEDINRIADNMTAFHRPNRVRYTGFQPSYIPVRTDRWQGRQEDLDGEGRSWRFLPPEPGAANPHLWEPRWVLSNRIRCGTHRLPHFALPIPEAADG